MTDLPALLATAIEATSKASEIIRSRQPGDMTAKGDRDMAEAGVQVLDVDGSQHTFNSTGTVAVAASLAAELMELIQEAQSTADPH